MCFCSSAAGQTFYGKKVIQKRHYPGPDSEKKQVAVYSIFVPRVTEYKTTDKRGFEPLALRCSSAGVVRAI